MGLFVPQMLPCKKGIKFIRIKDARRIRDDCLFFSTPWYPIPQGWESVMTDILHFKVGSEGDMNVHSYMCKEADGIFFDKFVYHISSYIEYGEHMEKFLLFTFYPGSRVHSDYVVSEKEKISDRGIRGENRPLYVTLNPYVVHSENCYFIDAGWTAGKFQRENQARLDRIEELSEIYECIFIERRWFRISSSLAHPPYS